LVEKLKPFLTKKELSEIYQEYDQNDSLSVSSDEFVYFWIAVARSGNPDLKIKVTKVNSITVDGYDLFY
jgi:mannitol-1-phosphate/altronate dehydrogenase